ncbi:MAG: hypothetical protein ACLR8Y_05535 [Alistipes indistinctus]
MQDDPSRDDMLLMLDYGVYYEFLPVFRSGRSVHEGGTAGRGETWVSITR